MSSAVGLLVSRNLGSDFFPQLTPTEVFNIAKSGCGIEIYQNYKVFCEKVITDLSSHLTNTHCNGNEEESYEILYKQLNSTGKFTRADMETLKSKDSTERNIEPCEKIKITKKHNLCLLAVKILIENQTKILLKYHEGKEKLDQITSDVSSYIYNPQRWMAIHEAVMLLRSNRTEKIQAFSASFIKKIAMVTHSVFAGILIAKHPMNLVKFAGWECLGDLASGQFFGKTSLKNAFKGLVTARQNLYNSIKYYKLCIDFE